MTDTAEVTATTAEAPEAEAPATPAATDRRAAAIAAIEALDRGEEAPQAEGEAAEPETPATESAAPTATSKEPKLTTALARLARQDKELQALRSAVKGAVTLDQLKADPLTALKAAGHSPDKLLDLWLGTPTAQTKADGEQRTPAELVELRRQVAQMGQYLQAQQQAAQVQARESSDRQALQTVHNAVTAPDAGDRWETIAARADETGLASNGGGAYHLAVEVGNILANRALESLGQYATQEERVAAVRGALEEALDKVEAHLVDDARKRQETWTGIKKLGRVAPAGKAKPAARGMPANPAVETKPKKPLTLAERRKNAEKAAEEFYRSKTGKKEEDNG